MSIWDVLTTIKPRFQLQVENLTSPIAVSSLNLSSSCDCECFLMGVWVFALLVADVERPSPPSTLSTAFSVVVSAFPG